MKQYNQYKDSEVKWLGKIPSHWEVTALKRLCKVCTGGTPSMKNPMFYENTSFPWFTPGDFGNSFKLQGSERKLSNLAIEEGACRIFPENTVYLIGIGGTVGKVAYFNQIASCNQQINALITNGILHSYLTYYLFSIKKEIVRIASASTLPIINQTKTGYLPCVLPSFTEQHTIVTYLDTKVNKIDSYIAVAEKKIAALDELKKVTIANAVTHGIHPNVPMKDSGIRWIGEVPKHWEIKRTAIMFTENKTKNSKYEFKHAMQFKYGSLVSKNEQGIISEFRETYEAYTIINKDDIAINCLNLNYDFVSQRVAISPQKGILTSAYLILSARNGVNPHFFNYLFKAMDSMKLFHGMGTGIRLTLSYNELKKQDLPVPPLSEQEEIVSYINHKVAQIDKMRNAELAQIEKLKEYKQRLISDVVTGKVKV